MLPAAVGYVHGGTVRAEFLASMLALSAREGGFLPLIAVQSGPNLSEARNIVAKRFLAECDLEWLLMADTDMVFMPDAPDRLIDAADAATRPVMAALCYSQDLDGSAQPMMYQSVTDGSGQHGFVRYRHGAGEADQPVLVSATTTAFLLIHRSALEKVRAQSRTPAAPWFMETPVGSALVGEDMTFCMRCADAGVPVHVHTGVEVGHVKSVILGNVR